MAYPEEFREKLRYAVVRSGMSLTLAAKFVGISFPTAQAWKRKAKEGGDDWDIARQADAMRQGGIGDMTTRILDDFCLQFKRGMDELEAATNLTAVQRADTLTRLADAYVKVNKSAMSVSTSHAKLASALEMLEELTKFVTEHFPHHAQAFIEIIEPFGAHLNQHYGQQ